MSNSSLVSYTKLSPNITSPRNHAIDTISIHCMAGKLTAKQCLNLPAFTTYDPDSGASCQYAIGYNGEIGQGVDEGDRSWCTSSRSNDHRAITIEVSNSSNTDSDWPVSDASYASLLNLLTDICQRNGIKKLLWQGDKDLIGQIDQQNMTVHRWFAAKACPGNYLYSRHAEIAAEVNSRLNPSTDEEDDEMAVVRYNKLEDVPATWDKHGNPHATIEMLMNAGIVGGDGSDPDGNEDVIDLSHDMVRILTFEFRGKLYDEECRAAGYEPDDIRD